MTTTPPYSDLRRGMRGDDVKKLQADLRDLGHYRRPIDGIFGRGTEAAVRVAQTELFVTGNVDEMTAFALDQALEARADDAPNYVAGRPPRGLGEIKDRFGDFEWESVFDEDGTPTGHIRPDPEWARANIIRVALPVVGAQWAHREVVPAFVAALNSVKAKGLAHEIETFAIYSPRHKMTNPQRELSTHTWGIACDVNFATNMPGNVGDLHPEIVESFKHVGFTWGGDWRFRDDMHFQFASGY